MKKSNLLFSLFFACFLFIISHSHAQQSIQYFRPNNKLGLHTFETTKTDTLPFKGLNVHLGGNFTQDLQVLQHRTRTSNNNSQLKPLKPGFTLPMANLNIDAQLEDGIRVNLTLYLSTRHHPETWVKGGYVQLDKLPFLKNALLDSLMKSFTIKAGFYELDYGDSHFRRTDGGNGIYNPFIENYIMDAFATEIGGELYYHPRNGFIAMVGISNGQMNPSVVANQMIDPANGKWLSATPALHGKIGFDKRMNEFIARITGSFYMVKRAHDNPLYFGDRAGSHYYFVMEPSYASASGNAWSGRFNPLFSHTVESFMINPFFKYQGLEIFGTYEMARGRALNEARKRTAVQYAVDLIYRFPEKEIFWIGARYNAVTCQAFGKISEITINRAVASLGCFITKNILLKTEYVYQQYHNFDPMDICHGGLFNGLMVEAAIGF